MKPQIIFGFHAVGARMRTRATSVREIFVDAKRDDKRMQALIENAKARDLRVMTVDGKRLDGMTGNARHQGVVANVEAAVLPQFVDDVLDLLTVPPLLLLLDGVTDPHNLGACLRVADAAGAHAVIAPKDRSVGLTAAAMKVAGIAGLKSGSRTIFRLRKRAVTARRFGSGWVASDGPIVPLDVLLRQAQRITCAASASLVFRQNPSSRRLMTLRWRSWNDSPARAFQKPALTSTTSRVSSDTAMARCKQFNHRIATRRGIAPLDESGHFHFQTTLVGSLVMAGIRRTKQGYATHNMR